MYPPKKAKNTVPVIVSENKKGKKKKRNSVKSMKRALTVQSPEKMVFALIVNNMVENRD